MNDTITRNIEFDYLDGGVWFPPWYCFLLQAFSYFLIHEVAMCCAIKYKVQEKQITPLPIVLENIILDYATLESDSIVQYYRSNLANIKHEHIINIPVQEDGKEEIEYFTTYSKILNQVFYG